MSNITRDNVFDLISFNVNSKFVDKVIEDFRSKLNGGSYIRNDILDLFKNTLDEDLERISSLLIQPTTPSVSNDTKNDVAIVRRPAKITNTIVRIMKTGKSTIGLTMFSKDSIKLNIGTEYTYYIGEYDDKQHVLRMLLFKNDSLAPCSHTSNKEYRTITRPNQSTHYFITSITGILPMRERSLIANGKKYYFPATFDHSNEILTIDLRSLFEVTNENT